MAYLVDEGNRFSYVQEKDLCAAGIGANDLHDRAVENLRRASDGRITIRQFGPIWGLFFDGNFEASLVLLDDLWETDLSEYHEGEPVVAIPSRDVLCFCKRSSSAGIAEMRAAIDRLWPQGDHLITTKLFRRRGREWITYDAGS